MKLRNALKLTCLGIAGGTVLRLVSMLFFFDDGIGFYKDGGLMASASLIFLLGICVVAVIFCFRDKAYFSGGDVLRRNLPGGAVSLLSAAALTYGAGKEYMTRRELLAGLQRTSSELLESHPQVSSIHLALILCSILLAVFQLGNALRLFSGRPLMEKAAILQVIPIIWGILYLIFVFLYYARSPMNTENIYVVLGGVTLSFALLYRGKILAGMDEAATVMRCFLSGIPAVLLGFSYCLSNLLLQFLGKGFSDLGEIPQSFQIAALFVVMDILLFLFSYRGSGQKKQSAA